MHALVLVLASMKTLEQIRSQFNAGNFDYSLRAFKRVVERNISEAEIREAGLQATMVEDYPDDKYSPSSLLLGFTLAGRPLHINVSRADTQIVRIITLYEPSSDEWIDYTERR